MAETCGECGEAFASAAELVEHARSAHPDPTVPAETEATGPHVSEGRLPCVFCGAVFSQGADLANHIRWVHPTESTEPITV